MLRVKISSDILEIKNLIVEVGSGVLLINCTTSGSALYPCFSRTWATLESSFGGTWRERTGGKIKT